ncbi:hypothetical protein Tco_1082306 [Tanacetum coccineum]|uniref:Uncharacterized protein n=1 Tax=Tanacetum coccineum TaxID=301880 RepID=A0ABQ5I155_9ASTR
MRLLRQTLEDDWSDSNEDTLRSKPNRDAKFGISGAVVVGVVVVVVESCSIPVSEEGLMNLATKSDETEELCCCTTGSSVVRVT